MLKSGLDTFSHLFVKAIIIALSFSSAVHGVVHDHLHWIASADFERKKFIHFRSLRSEFPIIRNERAVDDFGEELAVVLFERHLDWELVDHLLT